MTQRVYTPENYQSQENHLRTEPDLLANLLPPNAWSRDDETADEAFYRAPRLVTHIDDAAIAYVTDLYRELIPANGRVLDLMSSWVSHLPQEATYEKVCGLGMNRTELDANPRLTERIVQNLNREQTLPFADNEFDACLICVSIQYLTNPVEVMKQVGRVLRDEAPLIITFSNRCFPTKAVTAWKTLNDDGHLDLVESYLHYAGAFDPAERRTKPRTRNGDNQLYSVIGRKKVTH